VANGACFGAYYRISLRSNRGDPENPSLKRLPDTTGMVSKIPRFSAILEDVLRTLALAAQVAGREIPVLHFLAHNVSLSRVRTAWSVRMEVVADCNNSQVLFHTAHDKIAQPVGSGGWGLGPLQREVRRIGGE
jgi:hypothetical protein